MLFWIAAPLIALCVTLPLLLALRNRRATAHSGAASDIRVYRDQLAEVDRDLARGVLTEAEAEVIRTEVSRRLLAADKRLSEARKTETGRTAPAAVLIVAILLAGGAALYWEVGAPGYRDLPMAQRIAALDAAAADRMSQAEAEEIAAANMPALPEADPDFLALMDRLRETLKDRPDDVRGLSLLAENEARLGNFAAARAAQDKVLALKGEDASAIDLIQAIDIMVFAAGGYVSPEAQEIIRRLLERDPENMAGRYYAGLTFAQNGRPDRAFPIWRRLLENGPQDAPWVPIIRQEIAGIASAAGVNYQPGGLPGPDAETMAAADAMSAEDRQAMIEGMVEGLADRLANDGGTPEEWARLIRALGVLGQTDRANAILEEARTVFASSEDALATVEAAARQAGLGQ